MEKLEISYFPHLTTSKTRCSLSAESLLPSSSHMWRDVQNLPSLPKNGESLMVKSMLMVGSSTAIGGSANWPQNNPIRITLPAIGAKLQPPKSAPN